MLKPQIGSGAGSPGTAIVPDWAHRLQAPAGQLVAGSMADGAMTGAALLMTRAAAFGLMPGFQEKLDDQQIQALVAYIRILHQRAAGAVAR